MTWRELPVEQFNSMKNVLIIDVRSPCEHAVERIPSSINIPLLSDDERAEIGTIYKQQGDIIARRQALTIISPKIPTFVDSVAKLKKHAQTIVVYCWRGGLRSESVASVLSMAGLDCFRLTGGYKAWRTQVLSEFEGDKYPFQPIVLVGHTGTGKTEILNALKQRGAQVLDLEELANHRGSVFGGLGLGEQPTQKNFDAELWLRLRTLAPGPVFVEGESRKIGRITVHDCVYGRLQTGTHALVTGTLERRAQRIADDYLNAEREPDKEMARALQLLDYLKVRLGTKTVTHLKELLAGGDVLAAVTILLTDYYDPLYNRQIERCSPYAIEVDGDDPEAAATLLMNFSATPAAVS